MAYSSEIANNLLYTPFDSKSNVDIEISNKLNEDEFCDHCYIEPDFRLNNYSKLKIDEKDEFDYTADFNMLLDRMAIHKLDENKFITWLNDPSNDKVYTISGNAGTGKSTYINFEKHNKKNDDWMILDVAFSEKEILWFGESKTHISGNFSLAIKKLFSTVLTEIQKLMFGYYKNDEYDIEGITKNFESIIKVYNLKLSSSYPKGMNFMRDLEAILFNGVNDVSKIFKCAELLENYFENLKRKSVSQQLFSALDLMLLLVQCKNYDKKHVILFDSLERFISHDEIYNREVDEIRKLLINYCQSINKKGNCHRNKFKFIMVIRNSTARMLNVKSNNSDEMANNLDLTGWFDTNSMIERKESWLSNNCNINNENVDLLKRIIGDLRICSNSELTGLTLFIEPLFNNNKRLMIDFIGTYIELPSSSKILNTYNSIWNNKNDIPVKRYAARSIVRGVLLQQLNKVDNLFAELKTYSDNGSSGLGHTRKLLTILYNNGSEMKLSELLSEFYNVKDIKKHWKQKLSKDKAMTIANILFYMNSYNRRNNDWIQFVDLQLSNSSENISFKKVEKLYDALNTRLEDFKISIMPSGEIYLKYIVASFEYFSLRYCENQNDYMPLFAVVPSKEIMKETNNISDLPCMKIIKNVRKKAIECIKIMKNERDVLIDINKNGCLQFHGARIANNHKGYINNFIDYIKYICDTEELSSDIKEKYKILRSECRKEIKFYDKV